jgi:hypothetical protein
MALLQFMNNNENITALNRSTEDWSWLSMHWTVSLQDTSNLETYLAQSKAY